MPVRAWAFFSSLEAYRITCRRYKHSTITHKYVVLSTLFRHWMICMQCLAEYHCNRSLGLKDQLTKMVLSHHLARSNSEEFEMQKYSSMFMSKWQPATTGKMIILNNNSNHRSKLSHVKVLVWTYDQAQRAQHLIH